DRIELELGGKVKDVVPKLGAIKGVMNVDVAPQAGADGHLRVFVDSEVGADVRAELAEAVVGGGWRLFQLRNVGMSLEEVFLQLTTQDTADAADEDVDDDAELEVAQPS